MVLAIKQVGLPVSSFALENSKFISSMSWPFTAIEFQLFLLFLSIYSIFKLRYEINSKLVFTKLIDIKVSKKKSYPNAEVLSL